ncbi:MAG UNVERIFIED_CONTAM: hypothetical protein LVT10_05440 [Anaerolineae bacterium]
MQDVGLPMFRRQAVREAYLDLHLAQHHIQGIWLVNTQITNALSNTRQQILRWLGLQIGLRSGHYIYSSQRSRSWGKPVSADGSTRFG